MNSLRARFRIQTTFLIRNLCNNISFEVCKPRECHVDSGTVNYIKSCHRLSSTNLFSKESIFVKWTVLTNRSYSKWKKTKSPDKVEESDEEDNTESQDFEDAFDDYNITKKTVTSFRLDSILKAGLGMSKKKVEKDFYTGKIRIDGEKVIKKSTSVGVDNELDVVQGASPENPKMLLVDRIIIKSIGRANENGNFPVKMQVLKSLTIDNYSDPYVKASLEEGD